MGDANHSMWGHLPLLLRANSKESVEYILQALWRTRRTGLDAADRQVFRDMLQLPNDSDLDSLLVCLRILMRRCVYDNVSKDGFSKLFPVEVLPELQRLLTLLLQKFQKEWQEDKSKDQSVLPRLKSMASSMANQNMDQAESVATINLKLQNNALQDKDVKFQLAKDTMGMMLKSMYCIGDEMTEPALSAYAPEKILHLYQDVEPGPSKISFYSLQFVFKSFLFTIPSLAQLSSISF